MNLLNKSRALKISLYCLVCSYFYPSYAYAYLDPGSGNAIIYVLISLIGAFLYFIKDLFYKISKKDKTDKASLESDKSSKHNEIIIFSEGKIYWLTFKPIIEELIAANKAFTYLTMDIHDPALTIDNQLMNSKYVGKGSAGFAKIAGYRGKVMLSTTPNIGTPGYPMPKPSRIECLAHVCHGVGDIALYHKGSLDFYDAVLMVGDFMLNSIRKVEQMRNLKNKECISLGLPYLDELNKNASIKKDKSNPAVILVAPSWGQKSSLTLYGSLFIEQLAKAGYSVILRPHPYSFIIEPEIIESVCDSLKSYSNVVIDKDVNSTKSMQQADILISDKSCIRFDFAFIYQKPVISLDIPLTNKDAYEVSDLGSVWEDTVAYRLGPVIDMKNFDNILPLVEKALNIPAESIVDFRSECVANFGSSSKAIVNWAIDKCKMEN